MKIFLIGSPALMRTLLPINIWKCLFSHWVKIMANIVYKKMKQQKKKSILMASICEYSVYLPKITHRIENYMWSLIYILCNSVLLLSYLNRITLKKSFKPVEEHKHDSNESL